MNTLQFGTTGEEVKSLQEMLRKAGYFKYPTNTGYFGDITKKALTAFQAAKQLPTTGAYDPASQKALTSFNTIEELVSHPAIANTELAKSFKQIQSLPATPENEQYNYIAQRVNDYSKNPAAVNYELNISPEEIQGALTEAGKQIQPYYDQQQNYELGGNQADINYTKDKYNTDISTLDNAASDAKIAQDNEEGVKGTWASSARKDRMLSLQNKYNTKYQETYDAAAKTMGDNLRNREYQYGASGVLPEANMLAKTTSNFMTPENPTTVANTQTIYNPFGYAGRRKAEQKSTQNTMAGQRVMGNYY